MAIYHFSVKNISRSDGRSAVAAAAYRSGEKLIDERQGKEQDYTRKSGIEFKKIYAPNNTNPELLDRQTLWNKVEKVENRKNSQLAREFEIAFPHELKKQEREQLLNDLCQEIVKRHNVVVDAVIHAPHTASGSDKRNYHAHIMFTTRSINEQGDLGQKTREFNDYGKQEVEHWREKFADLTNDHLMRAGHVFVEVDHRSYKDQKSGLLPTLHEGSKVTQLRRQGIDTEISLKNDLIKQFNADRTNEQIIKGLQQELYASKKLIQDIEKNINDLTKELESELINKPIEPQEKEPEYNLNWAKETFNNYRNQVNQTAENLFKKEQQNRVNEAKVWLSKIDEMKAKTPLFFGKKEHLAKIQTEVNSYEKMRSEYQDFIKNGITDDYKNQAQKILSSDYKLMAKVKKSVELINDFKLETAKKISPEITKVAEAGSKYYGKILKSDQQGTIQQVGSDIVYHPGLTNIEVGKKYTLEHTKDSIKIQEDYEISSSKWKLRDKDQDIGR